jgi:hypothetical protein
MAAMDDDYKPFRWNLSKREQLPKVTPASLFGECWPERWPSIETIEVELRLCAARVIAAAGDSDWVFVGRTPEHLFDYLSGAFEGVPEVPSLTLLLVSLSSGPARNPEKLVSEDPEAFAALEHYFLAERLDPKGIASRGKVVTFIDFVAWIAKQMAKRPECKNGSSAPG